MGRVVRDAEVLVEHGGNARAVHRSFGYPWARAPRASSRGTRRRCAAVSLRGRPGTGLAANPVAPFRRNVARHCQTALTAAPTIRATPDSDCPPSSSLIARRRRRSNSAALPWGLMPAG